MSGLLEQPVSSLMKKEFISARKEDRLHKVVSMMSEEGASFVPVLNEFDVVVGTISERDLARIFNIPTVGAIIKYSEEVIHECSNKPVKELMTAPPITLEESHPVSDALRIFANNQVPFIPIVNRGDVIVGILSVSDIMKHGHAQQKTQTAKN